MLLLYVSLYMLPTNAFLTMHGRFFSKNLYAEHWSKVLYGPYGMRNQNPLPRGGHFPLYFLTTCINYIFFGGAIFT